MARHANPYLILALAIVLPGAGHVAVRAAPRGLAFAFFVMLFSVISYMTTTPDQTFIGRHAGGLFVWALSIPDAYRQARINTVSNPRIRAYSPTLFWSHLLPFALKRGGRTGANKLGTSRCPSKGDRNK